MTTITLLNRHKIVTDSVKGFQMAVFVFAWTEPMVWYGMVY